MYSEPVRVRCESAGWAMGGKGLRWRAVPGRPPIRAGSRSIRPRVAFRVARHGANRGGGGDARGLVAPRRAGRRGARPAGRRRRAAADDRLPRRAVGARLRNAGRADGRARRLGGRGSDRLPRVGPGCVCVVRRRHHHPLCCRGHGRRQCPYPAAMASRAVGNRADLATPGPARAGTRRCARTRARPAVGTSRTHRARVLRVRSLDGAPRRACHRRRDAVPPHCGAGAVGVVGGLDAQSVVRTHRAGAHAAQPARGGHRPLAREVRARGRRVAPRRGRTGGAGRARDLRLRAPVGSVPDLRRRAAV